jgi:hypothetical protein
MRLYIRTVSFYEYKAATFDFTRNSASARCWPTAEAAQSFVNQLRQFREYITGTAPDGKLVLCSEYVVVPRAEGGFAILCEVPYEPESLKTL